MMKRIIAIFIVVFLVSETRAQDAFTENWNKAYNLALEKKFQEALQLFEPLLTEQPTNASTHIQVSWCHLMLKNNEKAHEHAGTAYHLDQLNYVASTLSAYLVYGMGNKTVGKTFLDKSIWLLEDDAQITNYDDDIATMEAQGIDVTDLKEELNNIKTGLADRNRDWATAMSSFNLGLEKITANDLLGAKENFTEALKTIETGPESYQGLSYVAAYVMGTFYYNAGDSTYYLPMLRTAVGYMLENNKTAVVPIIHTITLLGTHYYNTGQHQKSFKVLSRGLDFYPRLAKYKYLAQYQAMFLTQYSLSANAVGQVAEARDGAKLVTELTLTGFDEWYQANAWYYLGWAWDAEPEKAKKYYQKCYDVASENGFEDLKNTAAKELN